MSRQAVIQVQCDRCKRVQLRPLPPNEKTDPDFVARFASKEGFKELVYHDICETCSQTIAGVWGDLEEWDREVKQYLLGARPAVADNQAAPLDSSQSYTTPPQPHSAAGAKRS